MLLFVFRRTRIYFLRAHLSIKNPGNQTLRGMILNRPKDLSGKMNFGLYSRWQCFGLGKKIGLTQQNGSSNWVPIRFIPRFLIIILFAYLIPENIPFVPVLPQMR